MWELSYDSDYERHGLWARGFFKAPRTGDYTFYLSADDVAKVFLNTTPNDTTFDANNMILNRTSYSYFRYYRFPNATGEKTTTTITL